MDQLQAFGVSLLLVLKGLTQIQYNSSAGYSYSVSASYSSYPDQAGRHGSDAVSVTGISTVDDVDTKVVWCQIHSVTCMYCLQRHPCVDDDDEEDAGGSFPPYGLMLHALMLHNFLLAPKVSPTSSS